MKNHFSPFIKNENQKRRIICSFKKGLIRNKQKCNNLLYSLHETSLKKSNAWTSLEISQKTTKNCTFRSLKSIWIYLKLRKQNDDLHQITLLSSTPPEIIRKPLVFRWFQEEKFRLNSLNIGMRYWRRSLTNKLERLAHDKIYYDGNLALISYIVFIFYTFLWNNIITCIKLAVLKLCYLCKLS